MYDRILLPTDGSEATTDVVNHAAELARHHDATLHAVYVVNTAPLSDLPDEPDQEGISNALEREGERALRAVEQRADESDIQTETREGSPASEIVDCASEHDCDVIVMGTHARSGVDRLLLGSVTERVVRSSTVPVLTIRVSQDE